MVLCNIAWCDTYWIVFHVVTQHHDAFYAVYPYASLLRDFSAFASVSRDSSASASTNAGRHARACQPRPCERCEFFTEQRSRHLIQYHLPWFAVPQSVCFECGANLMQQGRLYQHLWERHHFRPNELGDYSLSQIDTYVSNGCLFGFHCFLHRDSVCWWTTHHLVVTSRWLHSLYRILAWWSFLHGIVRCHLQMLRWGRAKWAPSHLPNHVAALFHWHLVLELLLMLPHEDQTDRHISGWCLKTWMTNSLLKSNYDMLELAIVA